MFTPQGAARAVVRQTGRYRRTLVGVALVASAALGSAIASVPAPTVSAAPGDVISSVGREFWLAFNSNYSGGAALTLFITAPVDTTGTVEVPGLGFTTPFTVAAGAVTPVAIPTDAALPSPTSTDVKVARGIHVTAAADVAVYGLNYIQFTTDAFLGLPVPSLGTDYRVLTYPSFNFQQQVSVVGTVDDTNVTVTPSIALGSHPAGAPYTEVVDRGEVLVLPGATGSPGPTGTRVQSSAPVAVFSGNECGNVPADAFYCDHLVEQLTPTSTWGRRFVTTPLASRQNGDTFRFLAATDGTEVRVNGALVATLNAGQVHEQILTVSSLIEASQPVLVAQFANGSSFSGNPGDPFMMIVPPYEQFLNSYTVTTPASGFEQSYVSIVAPGDGSGITLDGTIIPTSAFAAVGTSGYSAASLPVAPGTHRLSAAQPFGLAIYGFNQDDSYGYTGGLGLAEVASVVRVELTPETGTATVGTSTCVTGRAFAAGDVPVDGVRMDFVVTGVNPTSGFGITDATGAAEFCYTGAAAGTDTITGTVSGISDTATRTWTSAPPINTPPVANPQSVTTDENVAVPIVLTGSDADSNPLSFAIASPPANGTLTGSGANLTYTPAPGFFGSDSFTFTVNDGQATSPPATVSITVREVDESNQPPIAKPIVVVTKKDVAVKVYLNTLDPDGDPTTETVTSLPAHGTLVPEGPYFMYTPTLGFVGFDSFTYTTSDGKATSAPATVSIKVGNPPPPPVELRVTDDAARTVDVRPLDGQTFRGGEPIYAFVGPSDVFGYIKQVSFWIDDPARTGTRFSLDAAREFDLARTASNGLAFPLESNLLAVGTHSVVAVVEYKNASTPAVLSATITIADTAAHRLQVSARNDRSQAVDLAGATLTGNQHLLLGTVGDAITGATQVVFTLDGTQVRTDNTVDYDLVGNTSQGTARALDTRTLTNGTHQLVATVRLQGGPVIVYQATFTVSN